MTQEDRILKHYNNVQP